MNFAPNANRVSGPKELADAIPTMYRPGTEDSKLLDRTGVSWMVEICWRRPSSRNFNFEIATLKPVAPTTWSTTNSWSWPLPSTKPIFT